MQMTMASAALCGTSFLIATFLGRTPNMDRTAAIGGIGPFLDMVAASRGSKAVKELFSEVTSLGLIDLSDLSEARRVFPLLREDMSD